MWCTTLRVALGADGGLTASQAIQALGRGVHVEVAELVLRSALGGWSGGRFSYGSLFSGIDCVAAAVDVWTGGEFDYRFAAEARPGLRGALAVAWASRGLRPEWVLDDATAPRVAGLPAVDLLAVTPECAAFSRRNRARTREGAAAAMEPLHLALRYVRVARPRAVLVEMVDEEVAVTPISAMLGGIAGYEWVRMAVCPWEHLGRPVRRPRSFWVGRRK